MATRKVKRYNGSESSQVDTEFGDLEGAQEKAQSRAVQTQFDENESGKFKKTASAPVVSKKQLADSGFDNLRDYLNNQKGLTRRGESAPRAPAKPTTVAPSKGGSGRGNQGGATADEMESYAKQRAAERQAEYEIAKERAASPEGREERKAKLEAQALEQVRPESSLMGAGLGGLKSVAALAKSLANRKGSGLAEYSTPILEGGRRALPAPQKLIGMKKGGKVKETVSSASKRADGIAQKGKTKGTMIMCGGGMTKGKR
jgi:hypothetical protein